MNTLLKFCSFALLCALCALVVNAHQKQAGRMVSLCGGLLLVMGILSPMESVVQALHTFSRQASLPGDTLSLILRLVAMAYLTEFAAQACRDAGEEGLSLKAALAGKILLAAQTVPLVTEIGQIALGFLP